MYPGLDLVVSDLDSDEVLQKAEIEHENGNITADVLQTKDVSGDVFFEYYSKGVIEPFYPYDICQNIDESYLEYSYPLYASQAFWYYNTEAFPDGQPITSWWQIIEKNDDGTQKYRLFTKEIGQESAYLAIFASFITNADEMAADYKALYGEDLEYTYDASSFSFEVPENNAGVEYLYRFTQAKMTFIGDGDELVLAVHNSTKDDPALCLASAGKIENQEESGYNIAWCTGLTPYNALLNVESLFVVQGCDNPAGARLFIRYITGGADGESGGLKPFTKVGNWILRSDVEDKKNPVSLEDLGARANDLDSVYWTFPEVQDMWTYWLSKSSN
jgi:iron(III) transport system substrate-binding protein